MSAFNKTALRVKMLESSCTVKELSQVLDISKGALYRRLNGQVFFTVPEVIACSKHLNLTNEERDQIFFNHDVA